MACGALFSKAWRGFEASPTTWRGRGQQHQQHQHLHHRRLHQDHRQLKSRKGWVAVSVGTHVGGGSGGGLVVVGGGGHLVHALEVASAWFAVATGGVG